jgi:predicted enzyme related to lactoylglutathione lyase
MGGPIHFEILADDPEGLATFYETLFGWEIARWAAGEQSYWMIETRSEGSPGINGGIMRRHFDQAVINTVQVASLDEMLERLESAGGKLVHGPNELAGVGLHAYCADPEGNLFGILQPAEEE